MKVSTILISILVLIVIFILSISGIVYFQLSKQVIYDRVQDQLLSVSVLKENQLNSFFNEAISDVDNLANSELLKERSSEMTKAYNLNLPEGIFYHNQIEDLLQFNLESSPKFIEFFIMTTDGKVHLSTDTSQEGKIKLNENYFINGLHGLYIQSFFYDVAIEEPSVVISLPLVDKEGNVLAVLAGRINIKEISDIMIERSGLGESGETYLVNRYNLLVTESRFEPGIEYKKTIHTDYVNDCLKGNSGSKLSTDYIDVGVITNYRWLDEREVCLIVKIDQEEAFVPLNDLVRSLILILVLIIVISIVFVFFSSKLISRPIIDLSQRIDKITRGDLNIKLKQSRIYEIQNLIDSLNRVLASLKLAVKKVGILGESIGIGEALAAKKKAEEKAKKRAEQLEKFVKLAVGREEQMIEMKKQLAKLQGKKYVPLKKEELLARLREKKEAESNEEKIEKKVTKKNKKVRPKKVKVKKSKKKK